MSTKNEKSFVFFFIIIVTVELFCDSIENLNSLHYLSKPLILISLIFFFWKESKHLEKKTKLFTLFALTFSLIGDILLMFVSNSQNFFIGGLLSFLIAHVFYIVLFLKKKNSANNIVLFLIILLTYTCGIFYLLKDGLGHLFVPVIIYMLVILLMGIMAYFRRGSVPKNSFILVFLGAIFFIISDSLLALNKFYEPLPLANLSIMITYSVAQLFIVLGIKKQL